MLQDVRERLLRIALQNAVQHGGKAKAEPVLGKLLAERPDLRQKARELLSLVREVVDEVNAMPLHEQKRLLEERWPEALAREKPEEKPQLPPLPNVEKYERVTTRFAPNPDCVLHLGSARAVILSHDYARLYKGRFYLRFDDTDPRTKRPRLEFYDAIREDLRWLGCGWDAEYMQSDRLPIYYRWAEKLLSKGYAYVCTCGREEFRRLVLSCLPCPCRSLPVEDQLERWEWMLDGTYGEGEAVVRIKTDLSHPNPAVREWPALRIIDTEKHPHPRPEIGSKYRVWPLFNFACAVDDHLLGITHIIRGKEHITNEIRQRYMYHYLGWSYPEAIHYGRLKITGTVLSKSKIVKGVEEGVYEGWSDPKLATFKALRRRGITPEAIRQIILEVGLKPVDVTLSWENLYAYNRKIIDPKANRYFFVEEPCPLALRGLDGEKVVELPLHPSYPERGRRVLRVKAEKGTAQLWVSRRDSEHMDVGSKFRLMGLANIEIVAVEDNTLIAEVHSWGVEEAKKLRIPLIHWLPNEGNVKMTVKGPQGSAVGLAEPNIMRESVDSVVQLVRYGFCRIDWKGEDEVLVYYAHP